MGERIKPGITGAWRPENWDDFDVEVEHLSTGEAFEVGATAMLKAIWSLAEESPTKEFSFDAVENE